MRKLKAKTKEELKNNPRLLNLLFGMFTSSEPKKEELKANKCNEDEHEKCRDKVLEVLELLRATQNNLDKVQRDIVKSSDILMDFYIKPYKKE